MKRILCLLLLFVSARFLQSQTRPVALFYMTDSPSSLRSFLAHSSKIGILVPAWYLVDGSGLVSGGPDPLVLEVARKQQLPVTPIVGNSGKDALHSLLSNALLLAREYKGIPQWDSYDHDAWFYIYRDQTREWVYYTDARTFEDRYKLVHDRGIQGFCAWVLGDEDPAIWDLLSNRK